MPAEQRKSYEAFMASQIKTWDVAIEQLNARADLLVAQIEDSYFQLIQNLRNKEKELKDQFSLLKRSDENDETWLKVKERLTEDTEAMKAALFYAALKITSDRQRQKNEEASLNTS